MKEGLEKAIEIIEKELDFARKANPIMAAGMIQIKGLINNELRGLSEDEKQDTQKNKAN